MKYKSKTETYTCTIVLLNKLRQKIVITGNDKSASKIDNCIRQIKIAMENHEQDPKVVAEYLKDLAKEQSLTSQDIKTVIQLRRDILGSDYKQTAREKFENPLARRMESELPIILLQNPTKFMMTSVKRVSDEIIKLIDQPGFNFGIYSFLFTESAHAISLGAFKTSPTASEIKNILRQNDPKKLAEIMHIHFKFMQGITRATPIKNAPARKPVGKLAEIISKIWPGKPPETYFSEAMVEESSNAHRSWICDEHFYKSHLFTAIPGRGRTGTFSHQRTNQLGLMLGGQGEYEVNLPRHNSKWAADCKNQPADLSSQYVLDLINNDAVYVAGPSGMTSCLLAQMEILANLESEVLKKNYLSAVVSYIVGGGFHSLHEVIGPAQYCLNLVPGYNISPPVQGRLATPPNYNQFFVQQEQIDPEFATRHNLAWDKYLQFFNHSYITKNIPDFPIETAEQANTSPTILLLLAGTAEMTTLQTKIISQLNYYIKDGICARGNAKGELSFISRVFRNDQLTKAKLMIATELRDNLLTTTDLSKIKDLIYNSHACNEQAEMAAGKKYTCLTRSGLQSSLESIDSLIEQFETENVATNGY